MSKWYQGTDGWEDGFEIIDLGYDGSFTAGRRKVSDGQIIYEGDFWDAATGEKVPACLDVLIDGNNINRWIQYWVIPIE